MAKKEKIRTKELTEGQERRRKEIRKVARTGGGREGKKEEKKWKNRTKAVLKAAFMNIFISKMDQITVCDVKSVARSDKPT